MRGALEPFDLNRFQAQQTAGQEVEAPLLKEDSMAGSRYIFLGEDQYWDTLSRAVVEKSEQVLRVIKNDRRRLKNAPAIERRERPDSTSTKWISLGNNLYFDKNKRLIIKRSGSKKVLYSRDRRKVRREKPQAK